MLGRQSAGCKTPGFEDSQAFNCRLLTSGFLFETGPFFRRPDMLLRPSSTSWLLDSGSAQTRY